MRTIEKWNNKIRGVYVKQFTPRIQNDLQTISDPDDLPEIINSCFIYGEAGFGKTIYACQLLLQERKNLYLTTQDADCIFISVPNQIEVLKNSMFGHDDMIHELLNKFSSCHLLVLDDLGASMSTDWTLQILYLIINNRYENLKKTIITSNLTLDQLSDVLHDDRIPSRIARMCEIIKKTNWK